MLFTRTKWSAPGISDRRIHTYAGIVVNERRKHSLNDTILRRSALPTLGDSSDGVWARVYQGNTSAKETPVHVICVLWTSS